MKYKTDSYITIQYCLAKTICCSLVSKECIKNSEFNLVPQKNTEVNCTSEKWLEKGDKQYQ